MSLSYGFVYGKCSVFVYDKTKYWYEKVQRHFLDEFRMLVLIATKKQVVSNIPEQYRVSYVSIRAFVNIKKIHISFPPQS